MAFDWFQVSTAAVALYGAILSTARFAGDLRDRGPRLRIRLVPLALPRDLEDHLVLALEASNPGRLAVTVCNFGLLLADSTWIEPQVLERFEPTGRAARLGLTLVTALPFTVPPGERATIPLKLDALGHRLELAGWSGEVRLRPYCADATDRVHRGRPVTFVTNPGVFVGLASIGVPRCPARAQAPVYPPGGHFPT